MPTLTREAIELPASPAAAASPRERYLLGCVLALTALVYSPALRFAFVLDDSWQLVSNQLIQSWRFVPGYFAGHVWQHLGAGVPANYYRPLNFLWFRINDALFGLAPAGWHAAAVLLHVLVTFLAYQVARRVTGRPLVAATTALVFGIHPMRHEVVGWISGTTESFWSVFFFAAFLAYLQWREKKNAIWMIGSCALYAAALFSKESAILLPLVVLAHAWLYDTRTATAAPAAPSRLWEAAKPAMAFLPVAAAYLLVRQSVLHGFSHPKVAVPWSTLLLSLPSVALFYVRQWLLPDGMSAFYAVSLQPRFTAAHVLLPLLVLAALALGLWLIREKLGSREVAFSVAWMVAGLLPAFDLGVFPEGNIVHDRYFYLPSFGAALLVALALDKLSQDVPLFGFPRRWLVATAALVAFLSYATANATKYWVSSYAVFDHASLFAPQDPILRNDFSITLVLLGHESYERGDWLAAEGFFQRAQQINPAAADNYLQLGMVDMHTGRPKQAEANLRDGIELRPDVPMYHFVLGIALAQQNNCAAARAEFAEVLALNPDFTAARKEMDDCQLAAPSDPPRASTKRMASRSDTSGRSGSSGATAPVDAKLR
jgi:tetratricopeptide (TPR) repeat protein